MGESPSLCFPSRFALILPRTGRLAKLAGSPHPIPLPAGEGALGVLHLPSPGGSERGRAALTAPLSRRKKEAWSTDEGATPVRDAASIDRDDAGM